MKLNAPKRATWIVALLLGIFGTFMYLYQIPGLSGFSFWMVLLGLVLLLYATATGGM
jgi:hypothetical protein